MTSVLSGISGQFGKALILGTFLPAVIFVVLLRILVQPLFPADSPIRDELQGLDTQWEVFALLFLAIVLSGILYVFNPVLIRMLEGYAWEDGPLGRWRKGRARDQLEAATNRRKALAALILVIDARNDDPLGDQRSAVATELGRVAAEIDTEFPRDPDHVLPTRLGNVIRSFEGYPLHQYGMEAINLWPRLIAKIDQQYAAAITDAKTLFDFMINCAILSLLLAATTLVGGVRFPHRVDTWEFPRVEAFSGIVGPWGWLAQMVLLIVFAYGFYRWSIPRARAWGNTVKSAFDLYRWDLLAQLGFETKPRTRQQERSLWGVIGDCMLYGDLPTSPDVNYADPPSPATTATGNLCQSPDTRATLEVTRGVKVQQVADTVSIVVRVRNTLGVGNAVASVEVTDTLPPGYAFVEGSATVSPGNLIVVVGTDPYWFWIDATLDDLEEVTLTYSAMPLHQPLDRASVPGLNRHAEEPAGTR